MSGINQPESRLTGEEGVHRRKEKRTEAGLVDEAAIFASPLPITGDRKTTTRVELWVSAADNGRCNSAKSDAHFQSWYVYYIGNSGLGPFNFAISAWQNLLYLAGWDPAFPGRSTPCGAGGELHQASTRPRTDSAKGQTVISLRLGQSDQVSVADQDSRQDADSSQLDRVDYERAVFRDSGGVVPYGGISRGLRCMEAAHHHRIHHSRLGSQLRMVGRDDAGQVGHTACVSAMYKLTPRWQIGTALYILGLISYQGALTCTFSHCARLMALADDQSGPPPSPVSHGIYPRSKRARRSWRDTRYRKRHCTQRCRR